jgi:hypothetical protein
VLLRPSGPVVSQGGGCRARALLPRVLCVDASVVVLLLGFHLCADGLVLYCNSNCFAVFTSVAALPGAGVSASTSSGAMQQEQALLEALGRWADRLAMVNEVFGSKIV